MIACSTAVHPFECSAGPLVGWWGKRRSKSNKMIYRYIRYISLIKRLRLPLHTMPAPSARSLCSFLLLLMVPLTARMDGGAALSLVTAADLTQTSTCASLARGRDPRKNRRSCDQEKSPVVRSAISKSGSTHPRKPTTVGATCP